MALITSAGKIESSLSFSECIECDRIPVDGTTVSALVLTFLSLSLVHSHARTHAVCRFGDPLWDEQHLTTVCWRLRERAFRKMTHRVNISSLYYWEEKLCVYRVFWITFVSLSVKKIPTRLCVNLAKNGDLSLQTFHYQRRRNRVVNLATKRRHGRVLHVQWTRLMAPCTFSFLSFCVSFAISTFISCHIILSWS